LSILKCASPTANGLFRGGNTMAAKKKATKKPAKKKGAKKSKK
jgi:hypothetical protein